MGMLTQLAFGVYGELLQLCVAAVDLWGVTCAV